MRQNRKKLGGIILATGALLLMAVVGFSQHGGQQGPPPPGGQGFHGGPGGRDGLLGHLSRELNLTDEQKAQIKKISESAEESTRGLREQMRTLHESQPDPLNAGTFDEAAVRAAAQARANIQVELEVAHARTMSQVMAVLTPEQRAQLSERRKQFEQKHRGGERRPDGAPGN
jgi:Spy/CpxP family protein refolding chaperone